MPHTGLGFPPDRPRLVKHIEVFVVFQRHGERELSLEPDVEPALQHGNPDQLVSGEMGQVSRWLFMIGPAKPFQPFAEPIPESMIA